MSSRRRIAKPDRKYLSSNPEPFVPVHRWFNVADEKNRRRIAQLCTMINLRTLFCVYHLHGA